MASHTNREWRLIRSDALLASLVTWVAPVLFVLVWWIFSAGLPRALPLGAVDLDHSDLSRNLIAHYDAHPSLRVVRQFISVKDGSAALRGGEISALVVIPSDLKRGVITGNPKQVTAFYNTQLLLIGQLIKSAMIESHRTYGIRVEAFMALARGETGSQAIGAAIPLGAQVTPLFNLNNNYAQFLVSAIIPALWQILMISVTIMALSREMREQGLSAWLQNTPASAIIQKLMPYTILLWLQGLFFIWFLYIFLGWPMNGSWVLLMGAQLLTVLASQAMGLLLFLITRNSARAFGFAAAYSAPSFAFLGVTFPISDMSFLAQFWRSLLPISHYIDIQLIQSNHGASIKTAVADLLHLSLFLLLYPILLWFAGKLSAKTARHAPHHTQQKFSAS